MSNKNDKELKLYVVRVIREAYVLAADEVEAKHMKTEIEGWLSPIVEVSSGRENIGWEDESLIFHNGNYDITLAEARKKY